MPERWNNLGFVTIIHKSNNIVNDDIDCKIYAQTKNLNDVLNGENNGAIIEENKEANTRLDSSTLNKESGGIDEHERNSGKNPETLAEHGVRRTNDSIWTQSDDSETVFGVVGDRKRDLRKSEGARSGLVDWGRRIQSHGDGTPREKKLAYGLLREISERRISDVDSEQRPLTHDTKVDTKGDTKGRFFCVISYKRSQGIFP